MFKPFEEVEWTPRHTPIEPCTFCNCNRVMEYPPGDVSRAVERDMAGIDAPREAPADTHVVGDDVALDKAAGTDDQTVGGDLPVDGAVNVDDAGRLQAALDGEGLAEMRRRKF